MNDKEWLVNISEKLYNDAVQKAYRNFVTTWDLPEEHIRILKDWVDWNHISFKQYFSIDFLREFRDYIKWGIYIDREGIDDKILKEFRKEIEADMIEV